MDGILKNLKTFYSPNLILGIETGDDAAVYKIDDTRAIVQTVDFFPPNVDDPYLFGKIAAANALSDIFAMGAKVITALNIACFPETTDTHILTEILRGGAEKVSEAGGVLCGGHTVNDREFKYGLSVTGIVDIDKIRRNNTCVIGDKIILTKPLGSGIVLAADKVSEASVTAVSSAYTQMETLNKYAADIACAYSVNAMTDVTGFGFIGHLNEMVTKDYSISVNFRNIPYINEAYSYAKELYITSAGQNNRSYYSNNVYFENVTSAMEELMFDPQTSGGLLISVPAKEACDLLADLNRLDIKSAIVADVIERKRKNIIVRGA